MSFQTWPEVVAATQGDGTAVTNSTTRTSIVQPAFNVSLGSNALASPWQTVDLRAYGRISTAATTPGTLTLSLLFGGTGASGTAVATFTTGTVTTSLTNATWWLEWQLSFRNPGATAAFLHVAQITSAAISGTTAAPGSTVFPNTAPVIGATFDSRASQQVDLAATWSVANASNTLTCHAARLLIAN